MKGYVEIKELKELFDVDVWQIDVQIKLGVIPEPIQVVPKGKRYWKRSEIDAALEVLK